MDKTNQVTFDVNVPIVPEDLDVIELFVSNKNQAGPNSDLTHFSQAPNKKQLTVIYEHQAAKQVVLAKRFFTYKQYFLRASESGYKFEILPTNPVVVVLTNANDSKPELFGEYLLPDNPVASVQRSMFFPNTAYITYRSAIDQSLLQKRYLKKQVNRKISIQYLKAFKTSTILIRHRNLKNTDNLMEKLTADIYKRLGPKPNIFLDQFSSFLICQFKSDLDSDKFLELIRGYLNENNLISEYLFNFELIKEEDGSGVVEKPGLQAESIEFESGEHQSVYECFNDLLKGKILKIKGS